MGDNALRTEARKQYEAELRAYLERQVDPRKWETSIINGKAVQVFVLANPTPKELARRAQDAALIEEWKIDYFPGERWEAFVDFVACLPPDARILLGLDLNFPEGWSHYPTKMLQTAMMQAGLIGEAMTEKVKLSAFREVPQQPSFRGLRWFQCECGKYVAADRLKDHRHGSGLPEVSVDALERRRERLREAAATYLPEQFQNTRLHKLEGEEPEGPVGEVIVEDLTFAESLLLARKGRASRKRHELSGTAAEADIRRQMAREGLRSKDNAYDPLLRKAIRENPRDERNFPDALTPEEETPEEDPD